MVEDDVDTRKRKGGIEMEGKRNTARCAMRRCAFVLTPKTVSSFLLLASFVSFSSGLHAATLEVGVGKPYSTIQAAIDAAKAGDVVLVDDGEYPEKINFLSKAITVKSLHGSNTLLSQAVRPERS